MKTIAQYCQSITDKTLFVFCNDCNAMPQFIAKSDFTVVTAFANLVSPKNGFDVDWFKYNFRDADIKRLVIVGHVDCHVIPFLVQDCSENAHWMHAKTELKHLEKVMGGDFSSMSEDFKHMFMQSHIATQIKWVRQFIQKTGMNEMLKVRIDGIIIDEKRNSVSEISGPHFLYPN